MKNVSLHRAVLMALCSAPCAGSALAADPLAEGFANPPTESRPRTWWHWMNGNITQDGISKDLAWMKQVGLGGVQNFDANLATPQVVEQRLVYMTPPWKDAFRHAVREADRHGLEFAIAASPGWSETGGPWVPPQDGLKKLVWSETIVEGGRRQRVSLAAPPGGTGPFLDMPYHDELSSIEGGPGREPPRYYADVAVIAVPAHDQGAAPLPTARAGDGSLLDAAALADGSFAQAVPVPRAGAGGEPVIELDYATPQTLRHVRFHLEGGASAFGDPEFLPILEAQINGQWRKLTEVPITQAATTAAFPAVTAQKFRLRFGPNTLPKRIGIGDAMPGVVPIFLVGPSPDAASKPLKVSELRLGTEPRIDRFEEKAGYAIARDYHGIATVNDDGVGAVPRAQVIDLTARLKADGTLDWQAPAGRWRILRLGYSLTGKTNHPATPEATGLEVDKFDGAAVRRYLQTYLGMYRETLGADLYGKKGLTALLTDSIEVGASNWTPRLLEQFRALRGYDARPWLPALAGIVVESRAASDAFLYDYRRTLADLMAREHYGTVAQVAHEQGLTVYGEALEDVRPSLGDDMAMRAWADVPMAALWTWNRGSFARPTLSGDMKGAASVAHLRGRRYVAAESMTSAFSPWAHAPADLRRVIDLEFAHGINRPVIHTSVHQPVDDKQPGLSLAIFGQYFNRHETWAGMARPWVDYIARTGYLLQQGRDVADVAYYYGEERPLTALNAQRLLPDLPRRHAYDFVDTQSLHDLLSVREGRLVVPAGASYRVLYLGGSSHRMTLPTLRHIAALAEAGATVVGTAPTNSPALGEDGAEFAALVQRLWSGEPVTAVGAGRVIATQDVEAALAVSGVAPDFSYLKPQPDSEVLFVHRRLDDGGELYWVNNRLNRAETIEARFRVTGRRPELWRADTGERLPLAYRTEGRHTVVSLPFEAEDSFFVVFREATTEAARSLPRQRWREAQTLTGAWSLQFQTGRGAPAGLQMPALAPLNEQVDVGVRYFSGVTTYTQSFELPSASVPGGGQPVKLDLGQVSDVADVRINGTFAGTLWHAPWQVEVGALLRPGRNDIEVRVANLWVNRLIGDAQPGAAKLTFTTLPTYLPNAPLRPAGLIGPVRLMIMKNGN